MRLPGADGAGEEENAEAEELVLQATPTGLDTRCSKRVLIPAVFLLRSLTKSVPTLTYNQYQELRDPEKTSFNISEK